MTQATNHRGAPAPPQAAEQALATQGVDDEPRLRRALGEAAHLKRALVAKVHEMQAALNVMRNLRESNLRLTEDLARLQQKGEVLRTLAYHDELTGLPNRRMLRDRLHQALAQANRCDGRVALLLLDLDGFKSVNDQVGHAVGDQLLVAVAERLSACVRAADTACRYGGDEFVIMLPAVQCQSTAVGVASKIRQCLTVPYRIDGLEIRISASIGMVFYPADASTTEELMKRADHALYRAKTARCGASISRFLRRPALRVRAENECVTQGQDA